MDYRIIECLFSIIGVILSGILIWGWTYEMRYKFKVKYFLHCREAKSEMPLYKEWIKKIREVLKKYGRT